MTQIPLIGGFKTVLILNDEETRIYKMSGTGAVLIGAVEWESGEFVEQALQILDKNSAKKALVVVNDMSEQFYKVDKLPMIKNPLDRSSMVKRKLTAAFPQYSVTGSMLQAEKLKGQKDFVYRAVMAAVPSSQKLQKINAVLEKSGAQILNVGLLPVEIASLVDALSLSLNKNRDKTKNNWSVFLAQNASGGLRQVVSKNGRIALTRITPIVNTDSDPEVWASEVSQELKATMTYLTRFDYRQNDNLEVIVISNPEAGQILEGLIEETSNYYSLTVEQAAQRLKIKIQDEGGSQTIEPLYARWVANKPSFEMDMKDKETAKLANARLAAVAAVVLLFFSIFYFANEAYATYSSIQKAKKETEQTKQEKSRADAAYQKAVNESKQIGYDINLVKGTLETFEKYDQKSLVPTKYVKRINAAMRKHSRVFSDVDMEYEIYEQTGKNSRRQSANQKDKKEPGGRVRISLKMVFSGDVAPEEGNSLVQNIASSIRNEFRDIGFNVEVSKFLKDMSFESDYSDSTSSSDSRRGGRQGGNFTAQIAISGEQ